MPIIGLLSDSHGSARITRLAVEILRDLGAQIILHLGDLGSVQVIDELLIMHANSDQLIETHLVFGNVDWDHEQLARNAKHLGIHVDHPVGNIKTEKGQLLFMHGHDDAEIQKALDQKVLYLCTGHTHKALDIQVGSTRRINPGALNRAEEYTVALLNTEYDQLSFHSIPKTC